MRLEGVGTQAHYPQAENADMRSDLAGCNSISRAVAFVDSMKILNRLPVDSHGITQQ
jgi:hypothetical protein